MTEQLEINNQSVWIRIEPLHVLRDNPNVIPTEYFTASYFKEQPGDGIKGIVVTDDNNETKLFESPVAALSYTEKNWRKFYKPAGILLIATLLHQA